MSNILDRKHAHKRLRDLYLKNQKEKHPDIPDRLRPMPPSYSDKTSNGLTKAISDFLRFNSHQVERISVTGRYIKDKPTKLMAGDVAGMVPENVGGKWIKSSMTRGSADISATIQGLSVKIEVKIGRDRQSEAQKEYQRQVESAGGLYVIATSFNQFFGWYQSKFGEGR